MPDSSNKLVSVIIPVYNAEKYLGNAVDSILNQTYRNIEIILVNDGSDDSSPQICDNYAAKHQNIHVVHRNNRGVAAARNIGIEASNGEYLFFVDSDDWIDPETIQWLVTVSEQTGAQITACGITFEYDCPAGTSSNVQDMINNNVTIYSGRDKILYNSLRNHHFGGYAGNKLLACSMLEETRYDESLHICEDFDFIARLAVKCTKAALLPIPLYHYRQHPMSATGSNSYSPKILSVLRAYEGIMPLYSLYCPEAYSTVVSNYVRQNLNILGRMKLSGVKDYKLKNSLKHNVRRLWNKAISDKSLTITDKLNMCLTRIMPATMLRMKIRILKHRNSRCQN